MIRRTASEVLRSLESRIARLEGRTAYGRPDNYDPYETGEMERGRDWIDDLKDDNREWEEDVARAKKAGMAILKVLNKTNVPFKYRKTDFYFRTRDAVVQALVSLGVTENLNAIIMNAKAFNLAGATYEVRFERGIYTLQPAF